MTRSEIFEALYRSPEIYRPPLEGKSALLEVTQGCSYGKCAFCDFLRDSFAILPLEEIQYKCQLLSQVIDGNDRLFLLGCNPFCLPVEHLLQVMDYVHTYLPSVQMTALYARADDVLRKSESDLAQLWQAGIQELHIGLESGSDTVLKLHNKGETVADMEAACQKLADHGFHYHFTVIPGLGGRKYSQEHALQTAALLSRLNPVSIWCLKLVIWENTPLSETLKQSPERFQELTPREVLQEEREMFAHMDIQKTCLYVDSTVLNKYTIMGVLPDSRQAILDRMDYLLASGEE